MKTYDYVVVGAGTTGCIVASRLSEDRNSNVLLIEAGSGFVGLSKPEELENSNTPVLAGFNWEINANIHTKSNKAPSEEMHRAARVLAAASDKLDFLKDSNNSLSTEKSITSKFPYPMAKVVGGGSTVNGAMSVVPPKSDFREWFDTGLEGWQWSQMEPIFNKFRSSDNGSPLLNIELYEEDELCTVQKAFYQTAADLGHVKSNMSEASAPGIGVVPKNTINGRRQSVDITHLSAAQSRSNLTVMTDCEVRKINFVENDAAITATGVEVLVDGKLESIQANNVILSAGAIHSPVVLMRSGVGDAKQCRLLEIPQILDLPGVGKNLIDHPTVSIWAIPKQDVGVIGEPVHQVMLRLTDHSQPTISNDLQLFMMGPLRTKMLPPLDKMVDAEMVNGVSVMLGKPKSKGYVELSHKSADTTPSVNINCLDNADDLSRMKLGLRNAWKICQHRKFSKHYENYIMWNQQVFDSEAMLENMIQTTVRASMHPVGTLKMGPISDLEAVTDKNGKLHGCSNVTVADASIMPTITTVPPNLTCMAIGERIANHLCGSAGSTVNIPKANAINIV